MRLHEINTLEWDELLASNGPGAANLPGKGSDALLITVIAVLVNTHVEVKISLFSHSITENTQFNQQYNQNAMYCLENNVSRESFI